MTPPESLLQDLRAIQAEHRHIPPQAIEELARKRGLSWATIRGVVQFYHFLSLTPRGHYTLYLSDSVTDRMLGSEAILAQLCQDLGVTPGQTRADGRVSLHRTACTGLCDQGPAGLINGRPLTQLTPERATHIAQLITQAVPLDRWPAHFFEVHNPIWQSGPVLSSPIAPGQALHIALSNGPQATLDLLRNAGLRGLGGAGFATWQKWQLCRQAAPGPRVITCNADEGEPGTFKDRMLLMQWAHEVIEGMTLAALAVGADQGILYVRGEYEFIAPHLQATLHARRQHHLLGDSILGSGHAFDVSLQLGAGAYVCGEETALLESIQGQRGIPRIRPPFPVAHGAWGRPTVNNNVETFVQAAQIMVHGADWFKAHGTPASPGTRLLSISGDVPRPGLYEIPWGLSVQAVLDLCGATDVQAVLIGGPSGHLVGADQWHRRIAFEDLPTGGAFTVFNHQRDLIEVARQYTHFFANESCGFCTPCRVGCQQLVDTADRLASGHASARDIEHLKDTAHLMQSLSHCGLGQTAPHPLMDVLTGFAQQVQAKLVPDLQAFDLKAAIGPSNSPPSTHRPLPP